MSAEARSNTNARLTRRRTRDLIFATSAHPVLAGLLQALSRKQHCGHTRADAPLSPDRWCASDCCSACRPRRSRSRGDARQRRRGGCWCVDPEVRRRRMRLPHRPPRYQRAGKHRCTVLARRGSVVVRGSGPALGSARVRRLIRVAAIWSATISATGEEHRRPTAPSAACPSVAQNRYAFRCVTRSGSTPILCSPGLSWSARIAPPNCFPFSNTTSE